MMDMMKKGAALMGAALLTVTLWSTSRNAQGYDGHGKKSPG